MKSPAIYFLWGGECGHLFVAYRIVRHPDHRTNGRAGLTNGLLGQGSLCTAGRMRQESFSLGTPDHSAHFFPCFSPYLMTFTDLPAASKITGRIGMLTLQIPKTIANPMRPELVHCSTNFHSGSRHARSLSLPFGIWIEEAGQIPSSTLRGSHHNLS